MTPPASAPPRSATTTPQPANAENATRSSTGYGWCAWHKATSEGVRLIQITEAGSGPATAGRLFACGPCRQAHHLVPLADRP
ncbi:hypothetical protein [Streptomyces sp. NPDC057257]|uniref:hypothetical protein n=1 Tax=Streptomyces sp. NPDC057257 TaxID=3346071 RepID=UPI00363AA416